jgi:hypothetical protein
VFEIILSSASKEQFDANVEHMQKSLLLEVSHIKNVPTLSN